MRNRELGRRSDLVRRLAAIEGRQVGWGTACAPTGGIREFVARLSDGELDFLEAGMSKADPAAGRADSPRSRSTRTAGFSRTASGVR